MRNLFYFMINTVEISFSDNHNKFILISISFIGIYFGIKTITSKNPILSVLYLIGLFLSISVYLIYIGLPFLGLSYLLVYIGAVSILFLFILMLINIRTSELLTDNYNSIPLAIIIILLFSVGLNDILVKDRLTDITTYLNKFIHMLENVLYSSGNHGISSILINIDTDRSIVTVTSKMWDTLITQLTHISSVGNMLYTNHYMPFILASFILLLAMVGTIKITSDNHI